MHSHKIVNLHVFQLSSLCVLDLCALCENGSCVAANGEATCNCFPGYTGDFCDDIIGTDLPAGQILHIVDIKICLTDTKYWLDMLKYHH